MALVNKSFDETLDNLLEVASSEFSNFMTYSDTDPLVILIKLMAAMSVSSMRYSSKYLNSKYVQIPSIMDTRSKYLLLETFDMVPRAIIPGTIDIRLEYSGPTSDEVVIDEGTEFSVGENEITFTILDDYYLKSSNSFITIKIIEGSYVYEEFYKINIANNRLRLKSNSVAYDYVKVEVDGEVYTRINHAEYSDQTKVYSVEYTIDHYYNVVFSDQTVTDITNTSEIEISYIQSTGRTDYDPLKDEIKIDSDIIINEDEEDEQNVTDDFSVIVIEGYTVGDTSHTESHDYNYTPSIVPTFKQAITTQDYENLTNYYEGIAISAAYDISNSVSKIPKLNIKVPFLTRIVVAPILNYYMTEEHKLELMQYLRSVGLASDELSIELLDPEYVVINISIGLNSTSNSQSDLLDIYNTITETVNEYFKVGNIKFGAYITRDYISSLIARSDERISYVEVLKFDDNEGNIFREGYQLSAIQLPLLGDFDISFNYKNLSVMDSIDFTDGLKMSNIAHYLQGSKAEIMTTSDSSELGHELSDSISFTEHSNVIK